MCYKLALSARGLVVSHANETMVTQSHSAVYWAVLVAEGVPVVLYRRMSSRKMSADWFVTRIV